ncbi:MAG: iron-containing redox enzyme family protein [Myxococcales bacterium]
MDVASFRESLLKTMERKLHWAWPAFGKGLVPKELLHIHLEQEYEVYVRDFPVLVGRAYVQCPFAAVRRELVENIYEEETGGIAAGRPHPELFLEYPRGLGMDVSRFERVQLLPGARRFREILDQATMQRGWAVAAAASTLFLEGTPYERGELEENAPKRPQAPLEEHPLVKHYGLPLERLALTKAHRAVEGDHRKAAWHVLLSHVERADYAPVISAMDECLSGWLDYRDDVAHACGLERDQAGSARLRAA